jgi:redox-sensing transcriptional repressor
MPDQAPDRSVGRLSIYRRVLANLKHDGIQSVFSHELAAAAGVTAPQVRRDIMLVGSPGSPTKGYDVQELIDSIANFLDSPESQNVALIGVGNLGRAILTYFSGRGSNLTIAASFDTDPNKAGRVINGCHCYAMTDLASVLARENINTAILAVPAAEAQGVVDKLVSADVKGLLNFVPARLRVPQTVFVENMDITASLEKVAYFARQEAQARSI